MDARENPITIKLMQDDNKKWIAMAFWYEDASALAADSVTVTNNHNTILEALTVIHTKIVTGEK